MGSASGSIPDAGSGELSRGFAGGGSEAVVLGT